MAINKTTQYTINPDSIPVTTSTGTQPLSGALDKRTIYVGSVAEDIAGLTVTEGQQISVTGWHPGSDIGGQILVGRASAAKTQHGITGWSPTVPAVSAQAGATAKDRLANYLAGAGETDPTGSGLFVMTDEKPSVLQFGAYRNGTDSDSTAMKHLAGVLDTELYRFLYMPNYKGKYYVDETTVIAEPGVRIFGDAGPTYQRGTGKLGIITFDEAVFTGPIFDLGNFRTTGNAADQWTVGGLDFDGKEFVGNSKQADAVLHTTQTNGPDRGVLVNKCSGTGMNSLFRIAPDTVSVSLANLKITNCNASENNYAVLSEGNCLGIEFVGNQAEQNSLGAIHGEFSGGITITDNMLEGQPNTINIFASGVGNRPKVEVARNYFEANSGEYVMKLATTSQDNYAEIGPNYVLTMIADDYILLDSGRWRIDVKDQFPVTLNAAATVLYGSEIFPQSVNSYEIRGMSTAGSSVTTKDYDKFLGVDRADYVVTTATGTDTIYTPYGAKTDGYRITGTTKYFSHTIAGAANDVLVYSLLMRSPFPGTNNTLAQVFNSDFSAQIGGVSDPDIIELDLDGGGWALVQFNVLLTGDTLGATKFRFFNSSGTPAEVEIASVAVRNYGAIPVGGKLEIYPITVI